jgi:Thioredoxin
VTGELDLRALWEGAIPYSQFVEEAEKNRQLWEGVYRTATTPLWALEAACARGLGIRLLVIAEDWCGDASSTVPVIAKLGDEADCLEMRLIKRDEHPEVMDRYLTNGTRSIPIVIAMDSDFNELGHWGPRPTELQQWFLDNKSKVPKPELYPQVRRWYARDRGETTLREVLAILD